jgi:hypothetical protein
MYRTLAMAALTALTIFSTGCPGRGDADAENAADTLTRRQKNEIIADLPIPQARAVRGALDASDQAAARAQAYDSITGSR